MPTVHELKLWPEFFEPVLQGAKTFEMRLNIDRAFQVGDTLVLNEFDPSGRGYTGRVTTKTVSHVMRDVDFPNAIPAGFSMLSFARDPIDMVLHCPKCGLQHVDAPEDLPMAMPGSMSEGSAGWVNPPHRSHLCHGCGHIWRPADVPTNGVQAVKTTGKVDSPIAALTAPVATEQAQAETGEANMFWNDADPERSADNIHEVIEREWSDGLLQIGDVIEIQRATRLSNIKVEIVPDPKDEDGFDYEIMPAHLKAAPVQQDAPAPSMVGDAKGGA